VASSRIVVRGRLCSTRGQPAVSYRRRVPGLSAGCPWRWCEPYGSPKRSTTQLLSYREGRSRLHGRSGAVPWTHKLSGDSQIAVPTLVACPDSRGATPLRHSAAGRASPARSIAALASYVEGRHGVVRVRDNRLTRPKAGQQHAGMFYTDVRNSCTFLTIDTVVMFLGQSRSTVRIAAPR
jgi:hypothetical protein